MSSSWHIFFLYLLFLAACTSHQADIPEKDPNEYHYINESEEFNVFLSQAARYLHMRNEYYGIVDMNDDSLQTVYEMYTSKNKDPYMAHKIIYKTDSLSILYKTDSGELSGYVYVFDLRNRLYKIKKYKYFPNRVLDQWVTFDSTGNVDTNSRFMLSADTLSPGETNLSVYVYPYHRKQIDSISFRFMTEKDTFPILRFKTPKKQTLLPIPPTLFNSDTIVLETSYLSNEIKNNTIRYLIEPIHKRLYINHKKASLSTNN